MTDEERNNAAETQPRVVGRPFQPGNPGRPKGSRNKLGEDFVTALQQDFALHGVKAIETVRENKPHEYLKVVASLLPKEVKVTSSVEELSDDELDRRIKQLASALSLELAGEAGAGAAAGGEEASARPN